MLDENINTIHDKHSNVYNLHIRLKRSIINKLHLHCQVQSLNLVIGFLALICFLFIYLNELNSHLLQFDKFISVTKLKKILKNNFSVTF